MVESITPTTPNRGPVTQEWTLTKVEYELEKQELKIVRHDIGGVTVSNGGSGSFAASGSNVQSTELTVNSGLEVVYGVSMKMVVPVVSDDGVPSISNTPDTLLAGQSNQSYSSYKGSWNCRADPGQTKTCRAYINEFKVTTPYKQTWREPGQESYSESTGVLVQQLWGQPILIN
ncbi:uncharacterized protein LOC134823989 [Bolinopsis microptera]|uniref:uncharacterized protein LOC134823989 n=1 Tax=Bolinopsis microptera TaxID=2820187 RepID=UPI00307A5603